MFDAVILLGGGEEIQAEVESGMSERRPRKRHWFVNKVSESIANCLFAVYEL